MIGPITYHNVSQMSNTTHETCINKQTNINTDSNELVTTSIYDDTEINYQNIDNITEEFFKTTSYTTYHASRILSLFIDGGYLARDRPKKFLQCIYDEYTSWYSDEYLARDRPKKILQYTNEYASWHSVSSPHHDQNWLHIQDPDLLLIQDGQMIKLIGLLLIQDEPMTELIELLLILNKRNLNPNLLAITLEHLKNTHAYTRKKIHPFTKKHKILNSNVTKLRPIPLTIAPR